MEVPAGRPETGLVNGTTPFTSATRPKLSQGMFVGTLTVSVVGCVLLAVAIVGGASPSWTWAIFFVIVLVPMLGLVAVLMGWARRRPSGRVAAAVGVALGSLVVGSGVAAYAGLKPCPPLNSDDRGAQSNLTNAATELSAMYQSNGNTFAGVGRLVDTDAPEFAWTRGSVSIKRFNGISFNVCVDGRTCQAAVVANWLAPLSEWVCSWWGKYQLAPPVRGPGRGPNGAVCWMELLIQTSPTPDLEAATGQSTGGTFYSVDPDVTACSAGRPGRLPRAPYGWHSSFPTAGHAAGLN